jgi:hypothetical protein
MDVKLQKIKEKVARAG